VRDLEFLPVWYAELTHRRRQVMLQVWGSVVVAVALVAWLLLAGRNVQVAHTTYSSLTSQVKQAGRQLHQVNELAMKEKRLLEQQRTQATLGENVEATRLLGSLGAMMPPGMSLTAFAFDTDEATVSPGGGNLARAALGGAPGIERRMRVRLTGVAPTDVDVATFINELYRVPFFEQVTMQYAKDRREQGHLMREFELAFTVSLTAPPTAQPAAGAVAGTN